MQAARLRIRETVRERPRIFAAGFKIFVDRWLVFRIRQRSVKEGSESTARSGLEGEVCSLRRPLFQADPGSETCTGAHVGGILLATKRLEETEHKFDGVRAEAEEYEDEECRNDWQIIFESHTFEEHRVEHDAFGILKRGVIGYQLRSADLERAHVMHNAGLHPCESRANRMGYKYLQLEFA